MAKMINKAAEETLNIQESTITGWFEMSKELLTPLIKQHSQTIHRCKTNNMIPVEVAKEKRKTARKNLQDGVQLATSKWASEVAKKLVV